jgi:hypothetical protein
MAKIVSSYDIEYGSTPSKYVSNDLITEMKSKVSIVDVLTQGYGLALFARKADSFRGHCPFPDHRDSTPSFDVDESRGSYHCFGCAKSGDLLTFFMEVDGLSFRQAIARLSELSGVSIDGFENDLSHVISQTVGLIDNYTNYFDRTDLPCGLSPDMFFKILAERLRAYEIKVEYDVQEIEWVDSVYKTFDELDLSGEHKLMKDKWNNISIELQERYLEYKKRVIKQ